MHPSNRPSRAAPLCGFTLIELVGVLAILAVLLTVLVRPLMGQLKQMLRDAEQNKTEAIARGVRQLVRRAHVVPSHTNLAALVAPELGWTTAQLLTNRLYPRRILIDDGFRVGPGAGARPPYTQGGQGSIQPANARLMVVSSVGPPLPASVVSGFLASTTFSNVWNTPPGQIPPGWSANLDPADLCLQRINLEDLFVHLILNNEGATMGRYSLNGGLTNTLAGASWSAYVIKGTRLGLHAPDGALQSVEIIDEPMSFRHAHGSWRTGMDDRGPSWQIRQQLDGCDLQAATDMFLTVPENPRATVGSTPTALVAALTGMMQKYIAYSESGYSTAERKAYENARKLVDAIADDLTKVSFHEAGGSERDDQSGRGRV